MINGIICFRKEDVSLIDKETNIPITVMLKDGHSAIEMKSFTDEFKNLIKTGGRYIIRTTSLYSLQAFTSKIKHDFKIKNINSGIKLIKGQHFTILEINCLLYGQ